ncbi:MAG: hypothetical protein JOZ13_10030 [Alphaproteobacteria bacterium]|nr:hypothetical protein [Alphaproteobacteria bacterium]
MNSPNRVSPTQSFMQARMTRDFAAAERIGNAMVAAQPGHSFARRGLARMFDELDRREEALPHWQALHAASRKDFEAAYRVAQSMRQGGGSVDRVAADLAPDAAFAENLRAVLDNPPTTAPKEGTHNVVICGVSYCGSTLFDRLLGSLPGVASVGESHWLVKGKVPGAGYDVLDFSRDFAADMVKCSVCGKNCTALTAEFRRGLAADRTNWYFRIAERLGAQTLVAGDKNPAKILDNDPLLRFDALLLFKSLPQAWWSELQKRKPGHDEAYYLAECERYIGTWCQNYAMFLESFSPQGKMVAVSFEEFTRAPVRVLRAACEALSLPFDEQVLKFAKPGHAIGGNDRAVRRLKTADYAPDITPLEPPPLPDSHRHLIQKSAEVKRVFSLLQTAHERTMKG